MRALTVAFAILLTTLDSGSSQDSSASFSSADIPTQDMKYKSACCIRVIRCRALLKQKLRSSHEKAFFPSLFFSAQHKYII